MRRRAVPREVGPPPGGPTLVHTQIPVVFFTQSGVPGEVTDVLASSHGPVDVCTQAMAHLGQLSKATSPLDNARTTDQPAALTVLADSWS